MLIIEASSTNAQTPMELEEVVQQVRQVVGWYDWQKSRSVFRFKGAAEYYDMPAEYECTISCDGKYVESIKAQGIHGNGYDGEILWARSFSHPPRKLEFAERALLRAIIAIQTHSWLSENSPYQLSRVPEKDTDHEVCIHLVANDDRIVTEVAIDRNQWLPVRVTRSGVFGPATWEFAKYERHGEVMWARSLVIRNGDEVLNFNVSDVSHDQEIDSLIFSMPHVATEVEWNVSAASRVEVRQASSGHLFVKPRIDGKDVGWFAVDTGTGAGMCISSNVAERIGLPAFGKTFAGGAGDKKFPVQFRSASVFELGPAALRNPTLLELPQKFADAMTKLFGFEWGGTVGFDFLSQVVAEFDLTNVALDLHDPATFAVAEANWHELRFHAGIPAVFCKLEDAQEGWFCLDTGAGNIAIVHSPAVKSMELLKNRKTEPYPLQGVGSAIDAQLGELRQFQVCGRPLKNVTTMFVTGTVGALSDPFVAGTFGAGILGGGKVIFDYQTRRIALLEK